jgi:preprotein translocase subunit Sec61beta
MEFKSEEVEFPFVITVSPGEPSERRTNAAPEKKQDHQDGPREEKGMFRRLPFFEKERIAEVLLRPRFLLGLGLVVLGLVGLVYALWPVSNRIGSAPTVRAATSAFAEEKKEASKTEKGLQVEGIPSDSKLIRITDPDKAVRCTGRLVRDNDSPRCRDVSDGRWCPNKCEK